jgi:chaperonin cofactor prefoldin
MKKSQLKTLISEIVNSIIDQGNIKKKLNEVRSIFSEAVTEVFEEGIKPGNDNDVRGILGFPFDKYIVRGSIKIETPDDESSNIIVYTWKLLVPIDDPELIKNLDESQETFEEKVIETITKKLRSTTHPGGQYTTGTVDVENRLERGGGKYLLLNVEMTIGWDV